MGINTLGAWRSEAEIALHELGGHLQRGRAVCTGARPREGSAGAGVPSGAAGAVLHSPAASLARRRALGRRRRLGYIG